MRNQLSRKRQPAGATLVEVMIGIALGTMLLAMTGSLWLYGSRSLGAMGNDAERDARGRNALHLRSRDLRPATQATGFQNGRNTEWLGETHAVVGETITCTWKVNSQTLVYQKTGQPD